MLLYYLKNIAAL